MARGARLLFHDPGLPMSVAVFTALLLLLQLLATVLLAAQSVHMLLLSRAGLQVEVRAEATQQDIQEFYAAVQGAPSVEEAAFVSSEQAYERQRTQDPELIAFIEQYGLDNPFPDTFSITLHSVADYADFLAFIESDRWSGVIEPSILSTVAEQERDMRHVLEITAGIRTAVIVLLSMAGIALLFLVVAFIRQRTVNRRKELELERLLGASRSAVMVPFITETSILLFFALALSSIIIGIFLFWLPSLAPALSVDGALRQLLPEAKPLFLSLFPLVLLLEAAAIPVLSLAGASLGLRHEPKKKAA